MRRSYAAAERLSRLEWAALVGLLVVTAALMAAIGYLLVELFSRWR